MCLRRVRGPRGSAAFGRKSRSEIGLTRSVSLHWQRHRILTPLCVTDDFRCTDSGKISAYDKDAFMSTQYVYLADSGFWRRRVSSPHHKLVKAGNNDHTARSRDMHGHVHQGGVDFSFGYIVVRHIHVGRAAWTHGRNDTAIERTQGVRSPTTQLSCFVTMRLRCVH